LSVGTAPPGAEPPGSVGKAPFGGRLSARRAWFVSPDVHVRAGLGTTTLYRATTSKRAAAPRPGPTARG